MKSALGLGESFHIALRAIRANKARGVLTTLGIVIGIVAVVLTMTAANGLSNKFRESFSSVGAEFAAPRPLSIVKYSSRSRKIR